MTGKELTIKKLTTFLQDRIDYAVSTGDRSTTNRDSIEDLLNEQFKDFPDNPGEG